MAKTPSIRTRGIIEYDTIIRREGKGLLCGVDEAGRGPIAGPVVAAAVIFSDDVYIEGVYDSKKVTHKRREELYDEITSQALCWGVGIIDNRQIDELNILNATKEAMNLAISRLKEVPGVIIADGNFYFNPIAEVRNVIKADEKSFSVAAASIIAKVTRDRIMCEYENRFPNYSFSHHKGYGTQSHIEEIVEFGYTEIHRRTFKLKAVQGELF
ncbi:MAG TPA: ribonuclease HII [Ignavibacteria bacterium]|nr:ribonuclease HII [Ignavibacteria bacterium]